MLTEDEKKFIISILSQINFPFNQTTEHLMAVAIVKKLRVQEKVDKGDKER